MLEYLITTLIVTIIFYFYWTGTYWSRRNVKGPPGTPIVGNMLDFLTSKKHYGHVYEEIYNAYSDAAYVGIYRLMGEPAIIVRDIELIKEVLVKSFPSFHDNGFWIDPKRDPLIARNPFASKGERWKIARAQVAPIFTLSKVKNYFSQIHEVCKKMDTYLIDELKKENVLEAKDLCSKYTLEVIASCAFGLEGQTFTNPNSDFCRLVQTLFQPGPSSLIDTISIHFLPVLGTIFRHQFVPQKIQDWMTTIIREVVNRREAAKEIRTDFLQSILDLKEKKGEDIDDNLIVGHCVTFLLEGFETSSTLMSFSLYELAFNQDIQDKVHQEIDTVLEKYGEINYDSLQEMTYLDQVMLETLRLHPAMYALLKICTKPFELPPQFPNSTTRPKVEVGTTMVLPVNAIHYDPKIYPNPSVFNPENFTEEKQKERSRYAFLSFGEGPRLCVGMKFGLTQSKAGLVTILSKYRVRLSPKTETPLEISPTTFLLASKNGIWITLEKRL